MDKHWSIGAIATNKQNVRVEFYNYPSYSFLRLMNHFFTFGGASDFNFSIGNKELQWEQCKKKLSQKLVEKCKGLDISEVRIQTCMYCQAPGPGQGTGQFFSLKKIKIEVSESKIGTWRDTIIKCIG